MTKLVLQYSDGDEAYNYTAVIPFEYTNKDDFCLHVILKADEAKRKGDTYVTLFDSWTYVPLHIAINIEGFVWELTDWFELHKEKI